jgi:hypothetical protein
LNRPFVLLISIDARGWPRARISRIGSQSLQILHIPRITDQNRKATKCILTLVFATLLTFSSLASGQETSGLSLGNQIALPNVTGRIDHFSVEVKGRRLFVAAVDNHTLKVIDVRVGQPVRTIANLAEPQGVSTTPRPIDSSSPAVLTASRRSSMGPHFKFSRL